MGYYALLLDNYWIIISFPLFVYRKYPILSFCEIENIY